MAQHIADFHRLKSLGAIHQRRKKVDCFYNVSANCAFLPTGFRRSCEFEIVRTIRSSFKNTECSYEFLFASARRPAPLLDSRV